MFSLQALLLGLAALPVYSETRPLIGTDVKVVVAGVEPRRARALADEAFGVFERIDEVMNEWRPNSSLSKLNANAGTAQWVSLPSDLCTVLRLSLDGAARTKGLFDPTWAALRGAWNFGPDASTEPPSDADLAKVCPLVSYRGLELAVTRDGCRARLARPGMQVGLGGLAKGWGVDRAVAALRRRGLRDFLVQAGGDLYIAGKPAGHPWTVGIRDPRGGEGEVLAEIDLTDTAFSTSGDYEHFFMSRGVRYHHLIDPRTCRPATASRSVSIVAASAVEAEVLSKAAFIEGGQAALDRLEAAGAAGVLIASDGGVLSSRALMGRLRWRDPAASRSRAEASSRD